MSILEILDEIESDSGKIAKQEIIEKYKDDELLKRVFSLAYNPNIVYGIKIIPDYKTNDEVTVTLSDALDTLDDIANRVHNRTEGTAAIVEKLKGMNTEDEVIVKRIIDRSLKMGCGISTINKAIPKTIPTTPYMGAQSFGEVKARKLFKGDKEVEIDVKMDGRYVNIITKNGVTTMVSRQGKNSYVPSKNVIQNAKFASMFITANNSMDDGLVLNGELMIEGVERYEANGMLASIISIHEKELEGIDVTKDKAKFKKKHMDYDKAVEKIYVTIWDFIPFYHYINDITYYLPRKERLAIIVKSVPVTNEYIRCVEHKIVKTYDEALAYFKELINRGEEGAILKALDGVWIKGKPANQIKMKLEFTCDLKIVGFNEGSKGSKYEGTLGSFQCESSDGLLKADPGGIKDAMRDEFWKTRDALNHSVIEVKCNGISQNSEGNYSLLHPVFIVTRDDTTADSLDDIKCNQDMVLGLQKQVETDES